MECPGPLVKALPQKLRTGPAKMYPLLLPARFRYRRDPAVGLHFLGIGVTLPLRAKRRQKLPAFSGPRINSRSSRLSRRLPWRRPAARGLALGSMLWLRSVLCVRPRAISVPLTRNCTELAALDAICRGQSVFYYFRERFRIPLSPSTTL
jgi:hypothetical protein